MALLTRASLETATSPKMLFSTWFRLLEPASFWVGRSDFPLGSTGLDTNNYDFPGNLSLFEWGYVDVDSAAGSTFSWSAIQVIPYYGDISKGPRDLAAGTPVGAKIKLTAFSPADPDGQAGNGFPAWNWGIGLFDDGLPYRCFYLEARVAGFNFEGWHHLLVAVDQSDGDSCIVGGPSAPISGFHTLRQNSLASIVVDRARYVATEATIPVAPATFTPSESGSAGTCIYGAQCVRSILSDASNAFTGTVSGTNPARSFAIDGREFSVPALQGNLDGTFSGGPSEATLNFAPVARAYTQVWWGKYATPNPGILDLFAMVKNDKIVPPSDPLVAQKFFGQSAVFFRRDKKKGISYTSNLGSGGIFTSTGIIADFTPGPGQ